VPSSAADCMAGVARDTCHHSYVHARGAARRGTCSGWACGGKPAVRVSSRPPPDQASMSSHSVFQAALAAPGAPHSRARAARQYTPSARASSTTATRPRPALRSKHLRRRARPRHVVSRLKRAKVAGSVRSEAATAGRQRLACAVPVLLSRRSQRAPAGNPCTGVRRGRRTGCAARAPHGRIVHEQRHGRVAVNVEHEHGAVAQAGQEALAPGGPAHAAHVAHRRAQRPGAHARAAPVQRLQSAFLRTWRMGNVRLV